jgi:CubicO group peptidase (beta-lactamase class C family)
MSSSSFTPEIGLDASRKADMPRLAPSAAGVDPEALGSFLDTLEAEGFELHSLMLAVDGHVITEGWWAPYRADRLHMQHSVTKSFMSSGVGIAIGEGLFDIEDKVADFFPEDLPPEPNPDLRLMTVRHLLTMSVGHSRGISGSVWRPIKTSWVREFFREPLVNRPGATFLYSSAASYMASAIVQKVTGERLADYMRPRFFEPLGITDFTWDACPHGVTPGGNGLSCPTSALLKLGELYRCGGRWRGAQVLPPNWASEASSMQILAESGTGTGYGYQWWVLPDGSFFAWGIFGQYVLVMPKYQAVLAVTGGMPQFKDSFIACVQRQLYPALESRRTAIRVEDELRRRLANARLLKSQAATASPLATSLSGKRYLMQANEDGVLSLTLVFEGASCNFIMEDGRGTHSIVAGFGDWLEGETSMTGNRLHHEYQMDRMRVVARAKWIDEHTLTFDWQFVESAFRDIVVCRYERAQMRLERSVNVNTGPLRRPTLFGSSA